jgi:hypothetical protein
MATVAPRLTADQAAALANGTDNGTNPPVKTLAETQSVTTVTDAGTAPVASGTVGAGTAPDAVTGVSAANTKQIIDIFSNTAFSPKSNVLDQYASYSYNLSWYLMPPTLYENLVTTKKINLPSGNLLVQSGGAPVAVNGQGRNQFFGLDYYIDNLSITSVVTGAGTGRAHNATEISFTITEPAGITLIDNLWSAVKLAYGRQDVVYAAALYAMVIRFYGYDSNGKPVTASDSDNNNSVVEKIIPFKIRNITFRVANKLVEYKVEAVAIPYSIGFSSNLGVIKAPIEITGGTVKDLLTNGVVVAAVSPDDGIATTPGPNVNSTGTADINTLGNGGLDTSTSLVGA